MLKRTYLIYNIVWPTEVWYRPDSVYITVEGDEKFIDYEMYWTELVESKLKSQFLICPEHYIGKEIKK
jgi:hypothetical protein